METHTQTLKREPFVAHRRSPGLHWWTDAEGKDHGPYVHVKPARKDARAARRRVLESGVAR